MFEPVTPRRKDEYWDDTERQRAIRVCARHLRDLKREHGRPPADVAVRSDPAPRLISPIASASWCTSPGQLCAELAE
jgi:hypothetical protein